MEEKSELFHWIWSKSTSSIYTLWLSRYELYYTI